MKSPVTSPSPGRRSAASKFRYIARAPLSVIFILLFAAAVIGVKHFTARRGAVTASVATSAKPNPVKSVAATDGSVAARDKAVTKTLNPSALVVAGNRRAAQPIGSRGNRIDKLSDNTVEQTSIEQSSGAVWSTGGIPNSLAALTSNDDYQNPKPNVSKGAPQNDGGTPKPQELNANRKPREGRLTKAHEFRGDLRRLPRTKPVERERRELEAPALNPTFYVPPGKSTSNAQESAASETTQAAAPQTSAPAPPPNNVFEGLDRFNWGAGSPPDTNGDAGPTYYIQTVNTSIGIFRKSDGFQEAAFTFNTFMSQGAFGNLCDTNNFGDPVVLYDSFEDRWIITDFAFLTDISGNVLAPSYQCFAASQSGNPLTGGWNFYSIQISDKLNDYPKFGIWPDGLYMSSNLFSFGAGASFQGVRLWAFNKAQMYTGSPTVKIVSFDVGGGDFTLLPSNARLQTGTPPTGRPNLFISSQLFLNALTVYKFHVDWTNISLSTLTGPDIPISGTSWPTFAGAVPQPGTAQTLDSLSNRAMVQNQYTNFGGTESLWVPHTVRRGNTSGFAAPRWYQVSVTGGTVAPNIAQAATWDPDGANVIHRWMPSLALDRAGNMAMGYSTSNSTTEFPSIKYAGRLAADPVNTFSLTEQTFFTGTASQLSSTRWGDYSSMTLDPDGCTFWYTSEYATGLDIPPVPPQTVSPGFNQRWKTKFGNIPAFPGCTPVGAGGTVSGTVTVTPGGSPISGVTVMLGSGRSTTTDGSGNYSFTSIPAGTYPSMSAAKPGYGSASASSIVVTDGNTTTQNFSLTGSPDSACLTDTTQADFQSGVPTNVDLNTSPGDVTLSIGVNQQNTAGTTTGTGFGTPNWTGQTFIPTVSGQLLKADVQLFCSGCGATPPNLTLSVRATAAGLPTGADLAAVTIPGSTFAAGTVLYTASFGAPATVTSGTQYALVLRPVSAPAGSGYFWIRSSPSTYANGSRVLSADSGGTWSADTTRDYNFKVYIGYAPSGNFISSPKDANPSGGITPIWSTFSWNGTTPANTSLQFQIAGSNNVNGPFNFVGPDGTAGAFFTTSPVQLSPQFYNLRYLEYKAFLSTTNTAVTPTLNDATFCFNDVDCTSTVATITPTPTAVCANSTGNTASGPAGMTSYAWGITNGTITSTTNIQTITYTAGASGTVTLSLTVTSPNGCIVSNSAPVTINPIPAQPTITPGGPTTFCAGGSVTLASSSATGNQWYLNGNPIGGETNQNYVAAANGDYTVMVTTNNCSSVMSAITTVVVNPNPNAAVTAAATVIPGSTGNTASVANAGGGATYNWSITNGTITGGTGTTNITYTAGAPGPLSLQVTVTTAAGCSDTKSANVTVANPTANVQDAKAAEPASGTTNMLFVVALNAPAGGSGASVQYATADQSPAVGHAVGGAACGGSVDYMNTTGTVNFAAGQQFATISVPVCADGTSEPDETFLVNLSSPANLTINDGQAVGTITNANAAGTFIISELRTSGPNGATDEFVELYNNTNSPLDASGYGVFKMGTDCNAAPVLIAALPGALGSNTTVIPARGHYLLTGAAYDTGSLNSYAVKDLSLTSDIENDRNIGLFATSDVTLISSANRLDAVGFGANSGGSGICNLLREGTNLPAASGSVLEYSFFRKLTSGTPQDTNANSADFMFVDTQGTATSMGQQLGAPGPENKTSPINRDATVAVLLLDNSISISGVPNRERILTPNTPNATVGLFGTLSFRRRIQNNTGGPVTRLRFRIVSLTTLPPGAGDADLRVITSSDASVSNVHDPTTCVDRTAGAASNCTVLARGTLLEQPPNQTKGGAYNSTMSVDLSGLPGGNLANGQSIELQFQTGVMQTGHFRFFIIVEALP